MPPKPWLNTLPSLPEDPPDVVESFYAGFTRLLIAFGNHIVPYPDESSQFNATQYSRTQQLGESTAPPSQTATSQQDSLLEQCSTKWPRNKFVRADFYNGRFTVHTDIADKPETEEDQIELESIQSVYDMTNKMLVYMSPDGEIVCKSTLDAQHFIGSGDGQDTDIFVGRPDKPFWMDDKTEGEAKSCEGAWGAVVRRDVPAP